MTKNNNGTKSAIWKFISNNGQQVCLVLALVVMALVWGVLSPYFFKVENLLNILFAICVPGVIVAGLTVSMLMGNLDLSQYANLCFSGMLLGVMLNAGWNAWLCFAIVLVVGVCIGIFNATMVIKIGIHPMIATIGSQLMLNAGANMITDGRNLLINNAVLKHIGFGRIFGVPVEIYVLVVVIVIVWYLLKYTAFGRMVYAVGGNARASELAGISVTRIKYVGYIMTGFVGSLAAILYCAQSSTSSVSAGTANAMDGITGVFLGGVPFGGGRGSVIGSILGVFFLQVFANGMTLLSVDSYWQTMIKGVVLLLSISIDIIRTKNENKVKKIKR